MKPIIAVNCDYRWGKTRSHSFVYREYCDAIIMGGGIPVLLPVPREKEAVVSLLEKMHGLLLTGGDDISPELYGETRHKNTTCIHPDKEVSDIALLHHALQLKIPVFAICYGIQLINVVCGGTLIQDIPTQNTKCCNHRLTGKKQTHTATIEKNTLLHKVVGEEHIEVNSAHHQAIKKPGSGLIVSARAPDGIIEAIEGRDHPFLLGVQWHPERLCDSSSHKKALFCEFIRACETFRGERERQSWR